MSATLGHDVSCADVRAISGCKLLQHEQHRGAKLAAGVLAYPRYGHEMNATTHQRRFLIAVGLALVSVSAIVSAQTTDVRGLDYRAYLSLERGMTEGQVLSIAGPPDLLTDQGFVFSEQNSTQQVRGPEATALAVKTYTYLPTSADPYATTITLVGGRVPMSSGMGNSFRRGRRKFAAWTFVRIFPWSVG